MENDEDCVRSFLPFSKDGALSSDETTDSEDAYSTELALIMHDHSYSKEYQECTCNYKCTQHGYIEPYVSIETDSSDSEDNSYKCPLEMCNYKTIRKYSLEAHLRAHNGVKPFECYQCGSRYTTKNNLKVHLRTHSGEKPFKCNVCDYKCAQKSHLKAHMRVHSGEKPFECRLCGSMYTTRSNLNVHMRFHTGEKPFQCTLCDYKCTQKSSLKAHILIHRDHTAVRFKRMHLPNKTYNERT